MRLARACLALAVPVFFAGCAYIHFGRLPVAAGPGGDAALAAAYTNLATENKMLKQELALARKEGDALRAAMERSGGAVGSSDLAARLTEATRELATLRATAARQQAERAADTASSGQATAAQEKLASAQRDQAQLQAENARLRSETERARAENLALVEQLKSSAAQNEQTQAAMAQLNLELLAQKQARAKAEQNTDAVRAQLSAVLAQGSSAPATGTAKPVSAPVTSSAALQLAKEPPAESSPIVELRTSQERMRGTVLPAGSARQHIVQPGETLEKIAIHYYGIADRWRAIYDANEGLLKNGQPLRAGMALQLPEN